MAAITHRQDSESHDAASSLNAQHFLMLAWKRKSLLALGLIAGLALGWLHHSQKVPIYQSSSQIIVIKKQGSPIASQEFDRGSSLYDDYLAAHQILLKSSLIVRQAVEKGELKKLKSFENVGNPVPAISGSLSILRDTKEMSASNVLTITYQSTVREDCPVVINAIIESYKSFLNETYKTVTDESLKNITKTTEKLRESIVKNEEEYRQYKDQHQIVYSNAPEGRSVNEQWLSHLSEEILKLQLNRSQILGRYEAMQLAVKNGTSRQTLLNHMHATQAQDRIGVSPDRVFDQQMLELELKELGLRAEFGEGHPEIKAVRLRMDKIREYFSKEADEARNRNAKSTADPVQLYLETLNQQKLDIDITLKTLNDLHAEQEIEWKKLSAHKQKLNEFLENINRSKELYGPIIKQLETITITEGMGGFDARIIEPPSDGYAINPGAVRTFALSAVLGLCGVLVLTYALEMMDKGFRTPDEIRRRLGLSVIGHIPVITPAENVPEEAAIDASLCTYYNSKSFQSEAFRGLRTALYFSTQGELHKVIQVTSPQASDGKSTLVANLAICIAQSGKRVVLIDADLRKPRVHKIFGVTPTAGLASLIMQEAELKDAVYPTAIPGLSIIPCGTRPSNPAELLTSPTFKELIDAIREEFDFVLIDTPPLLAVSDPSVVAPRVDGVILCVRISKNARPNAERARDILANLGANVLGVVVNGTGRGSGAYGYNYYNYGYKYSYGYSYGYGYDYDYQYQDYTGYYEEDDVDASKDVNANGDTPIHGAMNENGEVPPKKRRRSPSNGRSAHLAGNRGFFSRLLPWRRE